MTSVFTDAVYPGMLIACGVLFIAGLLSTLIISQHRLLTWIVSAFWVVTFVEAVVIVGAVVGGDIPVVITVGYLLAAIALLFLLGIARLGAPDANLPDPNRPILQPDQIARVDGVAAMLVAVAAAVVAWRVAEIIGSAA